MGHGQDVEDVLPAVDDTCGVGPVGPGYADGHVEHLEGGVPFGEPGVGRLVGGVVQLAGLDWEGGERGELLPGPFPRLVLGRVLVFPGVGVGQERVLGGSFDLLALATCGFSESARHGGTTRPKSPVTSSSRTIR